MARWELGKDIDDLTHQCGQACIACYTGEERRMSSRCSRGGRRPTVKRRGWQCNAAGLAFIGARDVVGGVNRPEKAFDTTVIFPSRMTHRRAGSAMVGRGVNHYDEEYHRGVKDACRRAVQLLGGPLPKGGVSIIQKEVCPSSERRHFDRPASSCRDADDSRHGVS